MQKVSVLQPGQVVGVDMEWKPSFGMVGKPRVSLLQLALKDEVFLLDLPQLLQQAESEGEKEKLPDFIQMLYSDAAITKLGNTPLSTPSRGFTQPLDTVIFVIPTSSWCCHSLKPLAMEQAFVALSIQALPDQEAETSVTRNDRNTGSGNHRKS